MTFIQTKVEEFIDTFLHSDRVVSNIIGKKDTYTYRFKRQVNCYSMIRWLTTTLTACLEEGKRMEREKIINHFKGTWLGDDYHGEAIESEIRALTTKISND